MMFEVHKCVKCGVLVIRYRDQWFKYPLMHGPGSGAEMSVRMVCRYKWGLFPMPHEVEQIAQG